MQIVIDIPEEIYIHLLQIYKYQNADDIGLSEFDKVGVSIKNGIPLPKGHGTLIDANQLLTVTDYDGKNEKTYIPYDEIEKAPVIIEADTESEE